MKAFQFVFHLSTACALAFGLSSAVSAATLDLGTLKCKDFLTQTKEETEVTLAWLDGYYMDEDSSTVIDFDKLKENAVKLNSYCTAHPDVVLGAASEELFGK